MKLNITNYPNCLCNSFKNTSQLISVSQKCNSNLVFCHMILQPSNLIPFFLLYILKHYFVRMNVYQRI